MLGVPESMIDEWDAALRDGVPEEDRRVRLAALLAQTAKEPA